MDAYAVAFGLMGISIILAGFNIVVTIICYRAPGMRWSRLPAFVWAMLTTGFLLVLAAPVLVGGMYMIITDRTAQTAFFIDQLGGSNYLYEDLFWFFGHPEVYILALPGFGIVSELIPVFTRKPLFGYKISVAGMFGVAILSFFVWQHHLFDSGMDPDMRPLFMLTTELISIPTGFIFLVAMGTFWKAKIRLTVPMLFAMAFFVNFLFGGISGVFLSDVPADTTAHGSFFVMAHFHYTIMGGLIFAFFGGIYYWLPKVMGITMNERLGKIHFWTMFIAFNSTFMPLFAVGHARPAATGLRVRRQPADAERLGEHLRVLPRRVDVRVHLQLRDVHGGLARRRRRRTRGSPAAWNGRCRARPRPTTSSTSRWSWPARTSTATRTRCRWRTCIRRPGVIDGSLAPPVLAGAASTGSEDRLDRCRKSLPRAAARPLPGSPRRRPSTTRPRSTRPGRAAGWRSARCRSCSARSRSPTSTCSRPTATASGCRARRGSRRPTTARRSWA